MGIFHPTWPGQPGETFERAEFDRTANGWNKEKLEKPVWKPQKWSKMSAVWCLKTRTAGETSCYFFWIIHPSNQIFFLSRSFTHNFLYAKNLVCLDDFGTPVRKIYLQYPLLASLWYDIWLGVWLFVEKSWISPHSRKVNALFKCSSLFTDTNLMTYLKFKIGYFTCSSCIPI